MVGLVTFFEESPEIRASCELVVDTYPAEILMFEYRGARFELKVNETGKMQILAA